MERQILASVAVGFFACMGLSGCGQAGGGTSCLGESATLTGRIESWPLGGGLFIELVDTLATKPLTSTPVKADGSFSLTLPPYTPGSSTSALIYAYPPAEGPWIFTGNADVQPQTLSFSEMTFQVRQGTTTKTVWVRDTSQPSSPNYYLALNHYSSDGHITGRTTAHMGSSVIDDQFDVKTCKGWNWELQHWTNNFVFELSSPDSVTPVYTLGN